MTIVKSKYTKVIMIETYNFDAAPNRDMARGAEAAAAAAACNGCDGAIAAVVDSLALCWNAIDGEDISPSDKLILKKDKVSQMQRGKINVY
jgi:hypothetical protein